VGGGQKSKYQCRGQGTGGWRSIENDKKAPASPRKKERRKGGTFGLRRDGQGPQEGVGLQTGHSSGLTQSGTCGTRCEKRVVLAGGGKKKRCRLGRGGKEKVLGGGTSKYARGGRRAGKVGH